MTGRKSDGSVKLIIHVSLTSRASDAKSAVWLPERKR